MKALPLDIHEMISAFSEFKSTYSFWGNVLAVSNVNASDVADSVSVSDEILICYTSMQRLWNGVAVNNLELFEVVNIN